MQAKSSPLPTLIPEAVGSGRCEIRPESCASEIKVNRQGRTTGVVYFDNPGRQNFQRARLSSSPPMAQRRRDCCCFPNQAIFLMDWQTPADWTGTT